MATRTCEAGRLSILVVFLLFTGSAVLVFGQNARTGEIRGTATDMSGAVIPDTNVTITNVQTGVSTKVVTDSGGVYDAPVLLPGIYSIAFIKNGFATYVREGVVLGVQVIAIDAQLHVGTVSQQVTVNAPTPLVKTETSENSTALTAGMVTTLPNVGRSWFNFDVLLPGVSPGTVVGIGTGVRMAVNGAAPFHYNWLINGASDIFAYDLNPDVAGDEPLDSISEVHADTTNFSAQYGNGSSVFNVMTKTGTNQWHGTLFEFVQNTDLNARNFFSPTTSRTHWNEFGGTVGGPIKHDKAFFFFSYQGKRQVTYSPTYYTVPTAAMEQGNFSGQGFPTIYDPSSLSNGVRTPLFNNVIPPNEIDPVAANIQTYLPPANYPGLFNNYYKDLPSNPGESWYSGSVDYNISSSNRLSHTSTFVHEYSPSVSGIPIAVYSARPYEYQGSLSDSWSISPTIVNQFNFGVLRYNGIFAAPDVGEGYPQKLGLINPVSDMFPTVSITGAIAVGINGGKAAIDVEGSYVESDLLTMVKGKHIIKLGGEYDSFYSRLNGSGLQEGSFTFSGTFTRNPAVSTSAGLGYADFLFGLPQTWSVTVSPLTGSPGRNAQLFANDDYKISRRLTLNLGLRYMILTGWSEKYNRVANFDPFITNPATNTLGALWFAGQGGRTALQNTDYDGFAPRAGFAWSPKDGWSIRGAYGIFDSIWGGGNYSYLAIGQGWSVTGNKTSTDLLTPIFTLSPPSATLKATYPSLAQGPPPPIYPTGTPSATLLNGAALTYYPSDAHIPYMQQAHFDIQHQLPHRFFVDGGYVWTRGVHILCTRDIDQVPLGLLGPGNAQPRRPYPQYTGITAHLDDGMSNYNSFQLTVKREFSEGFMFAANYTWSRSLDDGTISGFSNGPIDNVQNSYDREANYGLSTFDMRHIFNGYFAYELPFGRGRHFVNHTGILNGVIGGWQLSSLFYAHSGAPFMPIMGTANLSGSLAGSWYPNRIASGKLSNPTIQKWFDATAFVQPAPYTFGNSGRDILLGPGLKDLDASLTKGFPIRKLGEGGKLEFRADALDLFNHPNFGNPNVSIGTSGAGVISSSSTTRTIELGIHLSF